MGSGDKKRKSKKGKEQHEVPMITDKRFKAAESDPRFMEVPVKKSKVAVDARFNSLFGLGSSKASVDKRGKPSKNKRGASSSVLSHYYPEQEEKKKEEVDDSEEGDEESLSGSDSEELKTAVEDDTTDSESGFESGDVDEEEDTFELPVEDIPDIDKETRRLAVVNMDWTHIRAVDLFVTLNSFLLERGGQIMSVTVYPSEFGLKRMEEEAVHGPVGLFSDDEKEKDDDDEEEEEEEEEEEGEREEEEIEDEEEEGEGEEEEIEDEEDEKEDESDDDDLDDENGEESEDEDDDVNGIDKKKLRAYELSKLRYYFAVVECDSVDTADYLYQTCDGNEFERSGNNLDLRFIPDSMEFKHQPRDIATEKPANYKGRNFRTRALDHSGNLQPTWDEDEPGRIEMFKEMFKSDQAAPLELDDFLASASETDDDEIGDELQKKRKRQDKYRVFLEPGNGSDEDDEDDNDQDMEVTFNSGLEDISKRILENKDKKSETVWEATLRKKKEKKKARKRSKYSSDDESDDYGDGDRETAEQPNDFFVDDKQVNGMKANEDIQEAEKNRTELELLLMNVDGEKSRVKRSKLKPKKKGKKDKDDPAEKLQTVDYNDPRFSALLKKPDFAWDPTDPNFKRTAAFAKQVVRMDRDVASEVDEVENVKKDTLAKTKETHELSTLVRSVKMKSKQMPLQLERKVQRNHKLKAKLQK